MKEILAMLCIISLSIGMTWEWLRSFFRVNIEDMSSFFKITDVNHATMDTIEDSERLQCIIMDIFIDYLNTL